METYINYFYKLILPATMITIRIVFFTMLIGFILGFIIASLLTMYGPNGLNYKKKFYMVLSFIVNTIRSFPILILIVAISPFTRLVIGTTVGEKAVILPLSITATAFIARLLESSFIKVDKQLIEAAKSFGATNMQIMIGVIIKESVPSIISVLTMTTVNYIAATTIAGAVGGGGLGAGALTYGYQSFNDAVLYFSVFVMFLIVNITQYIGDLIYKKLI